MSDLRAKVPKPHCKCRNQPRTPTPSPPCYTPRPSIGLRYLPPSTLEAQTQGVPAFVGVVHDGRDNRWPRPCYPATRLVSSLVPSTPPVPFLLTDRGVAPLFPPSAQKREVLETRKTLFSPARSTVWSIREASSSPLSFTLCPCKTVLFGCRLTALSPASSPSPVFLLQGISPCV